MVVGLAGSAAETQVTVGVKQQLSNVSSRSVPPLGLGPQECIVPKINGKERCLREASGRYPPGNLPKVSVLGFV